MRFPIGAFICDEVEVVAIVDQVESVTAVV